ncbi:MAG: DNA mismatch repair endonuclease MutL, partial [Deltaproteobacteria bacterium]|nr:DNA mismatch repair endonuclease MutL [Deltaproteobacteria bacterium]
MGHIHVLDPHVVNQIAAGEVVERPASVVKELVENAIDAGSRRIEVRVREGGRDLIEVSDDGWGVEADDLERVFLSHSTSKVRGLDDLRHVATLGFRGEALASIGSVARAAITSRARRSESGHRIENIEGRIGAVEPAASSPGTVVRVEQLFARVPARRKFLRTPATELGHIKTLMGRFALAHPEIAFRLVQGTLTLIETGADESRLERIAAIHGPAVAEVLLEVRAGGGEPVLEAWIGPPSLTRADTRLEQVFLNGRSIRDRSVAHAVREAYRDLIPPGGRRPVVFLFLTSDPGQVDVNVHPGKAEVRWQDASAVHRVVRRSLRARLEAAQPGFAVTPSAHPHGSGRTESRTAAVEQAFLAGAGSPASAKFAFRPAEAGRVREGLEPEALPPEGPPRTVAGLRPVGQLLGTYLVLEGDGEVVLVDQHALHERVLFDRINERLRTEGNLEIQRLLVPHVVHFEAADAARLFEHRELLQALGWLIEPFGEDAAAINGVPAVLRRPDPEAALNEVLGVLEQG